MLFNSIEFLIFFPVVIFLYFLIPYRYRWMLLLLASYYFYMSWRPEYVLLIMASTLVDYFASLKMAKTENKQQRKKFLILSLVVNLGLLFIFKYFNFFSDNIRLLLNSISIDFGVPYLKVLLPVGISFYTFQTLSYTIDVYRGKIKPEKHLGIFAVYVAFFPQLVAGPIERAKNLLPQFYQKHDFDYVRVTDGLKIMLWGFFLKVVIADRLAILVNEVYNNVAEYTGLPLIIATYFFAFQIFCDFAGYSFIAIGAAKIMGYNLMDNFRRPYFSASISEFWKRWHISLSTWFRDYLYIPLGGNRVKRRRWLINIMAVFVISGFWHGAGWTFVIWGGLHGFYLIFSIITKSIRNKFANFIKISAYPRLRKALKIIITFHLVLLAWVFFRANTLADAFYIFKNMFANLIQDYAAVHLGGMGGYWGLFIALALLAVMIIVQIIREYFSDTVKKLSRHIIVRWSFYYLIIILILLFGMFEKRDFIYFQF